MSDLVNDGPRGEKIHVAVIGGGVIGVCCASLLLREGFAVTIVEPDEIASGSSFGNAGCFNPSSVVPMSMPGNLSKVPGWLLDPLGPLSIRWSYLPKIAPWLLQFLKAGSASNVEKQAVALGGICSAIPPASICRSSRTPVLASCCDATVTSWPIGRVLDFEADAFAWQLRERNGIEYSVLENEALWQHEPALSRDYRLGVFLPGNGHTVNPQSFRPGTRQRLCPRRRARPARPGARLRAGRRKTCRAPNG